MNFQAFQSKDKNYATTIIKDGRITALVQKVLTAAPSLPSAPGLPGSPCWEKLSVTWIAIPADESDRT